MSAPNSLRQIDDHPYFEQFVWALESRGVADIDVPVLILGIDAWRQLLVPALASWALFVSLHMLVNRRCGVPARYALTAPLGWVLSCAVLVGSAYGVLTGRGLTWKGRKFYARGGVRPPRTRASR